MYICMQFSRQCDDDICIIACDMRHGDVRGTWEMEQNINILK